MTELERILLDNLKRMEKDMVVAREALIRGQAEQAHTLEEQRQVLDAQGQALKRLQEQSARMSADLWALTERLQAWGGLCESLETLLPRLNAMLNGK
jgi:septal ring factor EnvC (AmiA/AmiB activator)